MKTYKMFLPLMGIVAAALLLIGLSLLAPAGQISADTIPTPISIQAGGASTLNAVFWSSDNQAASEASNSIQAPSYGSLILHYNIDQTDINTSTIITRWSLDPTCASAPSTAVWSDGPTVVNANAADADGIVQQANLGRCTQLYNTVTNTNPVTITVWGLFR